MIPMKERNRTAPPIAPPMIAPWWEECLGVEVEEDVEEAVAVGGAAVNSVVSVARW